MIMNGEKARNWKEGIVAYFRPIIHLERQIIPTKKLNREFEPDTARYKISRTLSVHLPAQ
jgi:hypothetical protein